MFRNSRLLLWGIAVVLLFSASSITFAATQNAVVYGTVYDSGGNPLPGVEVTLENPAIGFSRNATTGSDGSYTFPEVPPAENFRLTAIQADKKIDVRSGITVNVGDERVILPPLKEQPVATNQPVETKTEAPAVSNETVSTTISGVVTGDQLRSLPVAVNRNFLALGVIPPNTHDPEPGSNLLGASFSVSGNRPASNSFLLDGSDNVASSSNQAVPFQVNDSVQEFRVISGTPNAEYGRNLGGVVNVVTRRGSNGFHGGLFGYFNNDTLNASSPLSVYNGTTFDKAAGYAGPVNSTYAGFTPLTYNDYVATANNGAVATQAGGRFCTDSNSLTAGPGLVACPATGLFGKNTPFNPASILRTNNSHKTPFDSKQFGANLGGPLKKEKWFAFGSYEGTMIDNPNPVFERVPSAFDETYAPFGNFGFGFGPTNPNYVLGQKVLQLLPGSNVIGVPGVLEFYRGQAPNYTTVHNALFRTDYIQSTNTTVSGRYAAQFLNELHDDSLPSNPAYPGNGAFRDVLNQNLNLSVSHTFNPRWITEARVGFSRFRVNETSQDHNLDARTLGMPNRALPTVLLNGIDPQYSGAGPAIDGATGGWLEAFGIFPTLDYLFPFARIGAPLGAPTHRRDTTLFLADNTSWSHGKHAFKFGFEIRHLSNEFTDASFSRGFMYSSNIGEFTSDSNGCNVVLIGGTLFSCGNAFNAPSFDFYHQQQLPYASRLHSYAVAGFLQDSWHIHPRVTLNLGVRYEYSSPPEDAHNRLWNFDSGANGLVQENRSGVVDPFGQPCRAVARQIPSYDALSAGVTNGIATTWKCNNNTGVFNKIVQSETTNFAPRAGLAWDIFGSGKTVFRVAGGMFFDQLPASYVAQLMYNRPTTFANGNALYGFVRDLGGLGFCPGGNFTTCGVGNAVINPGVLNATSRDGVNPNSFYSRAAEPFAVYGRDSQHTATPYSTQMSASVQQQLSNKVTMEVGYIGNLTRKLPIIYNPNFSNEFNPFFNATAGNFGFVPIFTMTNRGTSSYHSGFLRVRAAEWHGLHLNTSYIWSKAIDNASSSNFTTLPLSLSNLSIAYGPFALDSPIAECIFFGLQCTFKGSQYPLTIPTINFNPSAVTTTGAGQPLVTPYVIPQNSRNWWRNDRGRSDFNSTHRVVTDFVWDVPSLQKSLRAPKWLDDWQFSGVLTAQTGQPFTIFAGPIAGEVNERVNAVGPVHVSNNPNGAIDMTNLRLASQSTLCAPPGGNPSNYPQGTGYLTGVPSFQGNFFQPLPNTPCTGNSARNSFTGPNYVNMNFSLQKGFHVASETQMLVFRVEFFNLFNHANFYNPISAFSTTGVTVNPDFGKIKSAHEPREIQVAIRYSW